LNLALILIGQFIWAEQIKSYEVMHVKMTRIESGVPVPQGFTLYVNVKIVTAKNVCPSS
jgi:hypothetical protein